MHEQLCHPSWETGTGESPVAGVISVCQASSKTGFIYFWITGRSCNLLIVKNFELLESPKVTPFPQVQRYSVVQSVSVFISNRNYNITCMFWGKTLKSLCRGHWKHKVFEDLANLSEKLSPDMWEVVTLLKQLGQEDVGDRFRHFGII